MRTHLLPLAAALLLSGAGIALAQGAATEEPGAASITFPIAELGNCGSKDECKTYCNDESHRDTCFSFAQSHGLMSKAEVATARTLLEKTGPGGCKGRECKAYCEDRAHGEECLKFAEEHGLIKAEEVALAQKVLAGGGPGGCNSKESCKAYCSDDTHQNECRQFAKDNNLEPPEGMKLPERSKADRILAERGGPGGCTSGEECKAYCDEESHRAECLTFGEENGLMSKEEAARARALSGKAGPGGCRGEECKTYCEEESHREACFEFAVDNGFINKDDVERAHKLEAITNGPGGCRGEECKTYCEEESHREACARFAEEHGFSGPRDQTPPEDVRNAPNAGGPGGCKTFEECASYCDSHREECAEFQNDSQGESGSGFIEIERDNDPGKPQDTRERAPCKSAEECKALCAKNPEACAARGGAAMDSQGGKDHQGEPTNKPYRPEIKRPAGFMPKGPPPNSEGRNPMSPSGIEGAERQLPPQKSDAPAQPPPQEARPLNLIEGNGPAAALGAFFRWLGF